jgi:glycosyltransferase involved in cell wall biosynthesis
MERETRPDAIKGPMRILDVTNLFPYPVLDGQRNSVFSFLRCLARKGVRYTLVAPIPDDPAHWEEGQLVFGALGIETRGVPVRPARGPARAVTQAFRCIANGRPWINRSFHPELARAAEAALAEGGWDIVQAEAVLGGQHLPARIVPPSVLIAHDCLSTGYHGELWRAKRSLKELINKHKVAWMERAIYRRYDRVCAISEPDCAAIRALVPGLRVEHLPSGVNLEIFQPATETEDGELVVFTGAMDFAPNVDAMEWFVAEIWPAVRRERPAARLAIVGKDPLDIIRALAERDATITVTGTVPKIAEWMARAAVIVSPLRFGTGMKNKVLEGAAVGKAMVTTGKGLENIALEAGRDAVLADDAAGFARETARLLGDPDERRRLGRNARRVIEEHYNRDAQAERLWRIYNELLEEKKHAGSGATPPHPR